MENLNAIISLQLKTIKTVKITTDGDCMSPVINNRLRIHRIISKDKSGFITKGDHSYLSDKRKGSTILGKATINCTQNRSLCSNRIVLFFRATISNISGKSYRRYYPIVTTQKG